MEKYKIETYRIINRRKKNLRNSIKNCRKETFQIAKKKLISLSYNQFLFKPIALDDCFVITNVKKDDNLIRQRVSHVPYIRI